MQYGMKQYKHFPEQGIKPFKETSIYIFCEVPLLIYLIVKVLDIL